MPMEEALEIVKVSPAISDALINGKGDLALILEFMSRYENADWQEVSRLMVLHNIEIKQVYDAYVGSLTWYRDICR